MVNIRSFVAVQILFFCGVCAALDDVVAAETNITSTEKPAAKPDPYLGVKKAHGILNIVAWWIFIINGVLFARYFKPVLDKQLGGTKVWFQLHRWVNIFALVLVVIGVICILIGKEGRWTGRSPGPVGAHSILGVTAVVCGLFNPLITLLRCNPGTPLRPLFNWSHRFIGVLAWCCASAAIFEITRFPKYSYGLSETAEYASAPRNLMMLYFVVVGFLVLVLEEFQVSYEAKRSLSFTALFSKRASMEPGMVEGEAVKVASTRFGNLRIMALLIFNVVAVSIVIAECVFIGQSVPLPKYG